MFARLHMRYAKFSRSAARFPMIARAESETCVADSCIGLAIGKLNIGWIGESQGFLLRRVCSLLLVKC